MTELTLEQQRARAKAKARARVAVNRNQDTPSEVSLSHKVGAAIDGLAQGLTFGFSDEIAAGLDSGFGFAGDYDESLKAERERMAENKRLAGGYRMGGEIAGALTGGVGLARSGATLLRGGLTLPQTIGRGAVEGAAYGGAFGLGQGEGLQDKVTGAGIGAGIGAVAGVALPLAAAGTGKAYQSVRNSISGRPAALRGVPMAAANRVARAVGDDSLDDAALAVTRQELGPEGILADAGENLGMQAEALAATPGRATANLQRAIRARQAKAGERVTRIIDRYLGAGKDVDALATDLITQRASQAQPAYQQAYRDGADAIWTPTLERLSSSPSVTSAMNSVKRTWKDRAVADGFGAMNPHPSVNNGILTQSGRGLPAHPDLQFWDYVKRTLDDRVRVATRAGRNDQASSLTSIVRQLREELDNVVPSYRAARDAYAGPSGIKDALVAGQNTFKSNVSPGQLRQQLGSMSTSEREAFIQGARAQVGKFMGLARNDALAARTQLEAKGWNREKLALLVGEDAADALGNFLRGEARMAGTANRIFQQSRAAPKQAAAREFPNPVDEAGRSADMRGTSFTGLMLQGGSKALGALRGSNVENINSAAANLLTKNLDDPAVQALLQLQASRQQTRAGAITLQDVLTTPTGAIAGQIGGGLSQRLRSR